MPTFIDNVVLDTKQRCYDYFISPLGQILLRADGDCLTGLWFAQQKYFPEQYQLWKRRQDCSVILQAKRELTEFFASERQIFDVPVGMPAGTDFQHRVWEVLYSIPYAARSSYGEIALQLGLPIGSARAVGGATGRNPVSIIVPCHRVVSMTGNLTGYAGGINRKQVLLLLEQSANELRFSAGVDGSPSHITPS
jgi:methylated-DNA-[protein]-cysteine S-methyltransferase